LIDYLIVFFCCCSPQEEHQPEKMQKEVIKNKEAGERQEK